MTDYFPLTTAHGKSFCNRKEELRHLTRNIEAVKPTLIMSPRRYGKTSLVLRAFELKKIKYAYIDLYKELSEEDIERSVINGIGQLLGKLETKPKQLLKLASEFFSDLRVKVGFDDLGLSLEVSGKRKKPADSMQEALLKLHDLAKKRKVYAVFFMDEFQRLAEIAPNHSIEAALRQVVQTSRNIIYVFSGSNRHLIEDMFFDRNRPFYKLCDVLRLGRISGAHYAPYIQKAALYRWNKELSDEALESILALTENHPYYVNLLCSKLWLREKLPEKNDPEIFWNRSVEESLSQIEKEIDLLSFNQKKLLISFARFGETAQPTGQEFSKKAGLSSTSLAQALSVLIEKDYLYKNAQGFYCILDPLIKHAFA